MATIRLGDGYEVTRYEGGLSIRDCISGHAPSVRLFLSPDALEALRWLLSGTCDVDLVRGRSWSANTPRKNKLKVTYASTSISANGNKSSISMHQLIMPLERGMEVDHINGDGLDNRRSNLRPATRAQNGRNMGLSSRNTSGYPGVRKMRNSSRWFAYITVNYKMRGLGYYATKEEAITARKAAAAVDFGEFARLSP